MAGVLLSIAGGCATQGEPREVDVSGEPLQVTIHLRDALAVAPQGQRDLTLRILRPRLPWQQDQLWGRAINQGHAPMAVDASQVVMHADGRIDGTLQCRVSRRDVTISLSARADGGRVAGSADVEIAGRRDSTHREAAVAGAVRPAALHEQTGLLGTGPHWPRWPARLNWLRVVDITTVEGDRWDSRVEAAQDRLGDGGGVIWFPPGEYAVRETIRLRSGIILRGAAPDGTGDPRSAHYALPARLVFPRYEPTFSGDGTPNDTAFRGIELADPDGGRDVGIVHLDIQHGHIHLGRWDRFPQRFEEGTAGRGFLVVGNIVRNAAVLDPLIPQPWQHPWQRWSDREKAAIHCYAGAEVLIAGNRLPAGGEADFVMEGFRLYKDKPATHEKPKTKEVTTIDVPFDYDNRPGIMVNPQPLAEGLKLWDDARLHDRGDAARADLGIPPAWGLARDIVIRGNYVFNTGCVAIKTSGDGTFVGYNTIRYRPGVIRPTYTGLTLSNFTNNNRAVEMKGWRWTVQGNDYEVYSNYGPDGTKYNDGEGIMHEAWENVGVRDSRVLDNVGNAYICFWRVPVSGLQIRGNRIRTGGGQPAITVLSRTNRDVDLPAERVQIVGNTTEGSGIKLVGRPDGSQRNAVVGNRHAGGEPGVLVEETGARLEGNEGYSPPPTD